MYATAYADKMTTGITENCAYSESCLLGVNPAFSSHVNSEMIANMGKFLKKFDSYGYKKINCEDYLNAIARRNSNMMEVVAMRLADVIGPYDESFRLWKYVTWIKTLLGQPTRLIEDQKVAIRQKGSKIRYEVPKDIERKLSITFSVDVTKFILAYMHSDNVRTSPQSFEAVNIACEEKPTLVELIKLLEAEIRTQNNIEGSAEDSNLLEPLPNGQQTKYAPSPQARERSDSSNSNSSDHAEKAVKFYPSVDCGPIDVNRARSLF